MIKFRQIRKLHYSFFAIILCVIPNLALAQTVTPWITSGDQNMLLSEQGQVSFSAQSGSNPNTITIDENITYQSLSGVGFALTQGSAEAISSLNSTTKTNLLNELFDPNNGQAISIVRISIGASDLSNSVYSYNETAGDVAMNNFSLAGPDQTYLIPVLKDILAINPTIKVLATPWTAPTWMKTNNSWIGGNLSTTYYQAYANYFVKYLQAMSAEGISIWAITPQNEPENPNNEPSMAMTSGEQINFINNHLGPAIQNAGFNTKIIAFDHNCDNTAYPIDVLNNSTYVDGAAFHLYAGNISALSTVRNQTNKNVYFTEQFTSSNGNFDGDFGWHMENVVIGSLRNWSKSVIEWNLATDQSFGPRTPGGCTECLGAITINNSSSFSRNVSYYIISQISRFIDPGAERINSNNINNLPNVAFKNPDGSKTLLVYNSQNQSRNLKVQSGNVSFEYDIPGRSAITFKWDDSSTPPPPPANIDAFQRIEAENYDDSFGVQLENTSDTGGGQNVGFTDDGDYIRFNQVDFGSGAGSADVRIASDASFTGTVEFRLNSVNGNLIGTANFGNTGGWQSWTTRNINITNASGINDLFLVFKGGIGIGNINWFQFYASPVTIPSTPSSLNAAAVSSSSIDLNWQDNSNNELAFEVQRSLTGNNNWNVISTTAADVSSFNDNSLSENTIYFYRVRAVNSAGSSAWSTVANATTQSQVSSGIVSGTTYQIINTGSGKAMDVSGVSTANGARIQQWTPSGGSNQQWLVESVENNEYRLTAVHSGKVLDVVNGGTNNNARIQQWDYFGNDNQKWRIESNGNDTYKIISVNSGKALDVFSNSNNNGAELVQYTARNDSHQNWSFNVVSGAREEIVLSTDGDNMQDAIILYPNPAKDSIRISGKQVRSFEIIDQSGRIIIQKNQILENQPLDISNLGNGLYLVNLKLINGRSISRSLIKN